MQLSVLITAYHYADLPTTVAPLLRDPATAEVIVVIDGSPDGSFETLRQMATTEPKLRPFYIENRGRPGASQFALDQAECDVVLSIDQDVLAHEGLVTGHAQLHAQAPNRVVVGYMPTTAPPRQPGSFVIDRYATEYEMNCESWEENPDRILGRFWGGNVSLPREALFAIGGYDSGVGLQYSHDQELGLRLQALGLEPVFDRRLRADHLFERSVDGYLKAARRQGRDLAIIGKVHPERSELPTWRQTNIGGRLRRIALRPRAYGAASSAGRQLLGWLGRAHLWAAELRLGAFLERLELQRGLQQGIRETASWPSAGTPEVGKRAAAVAR